MQAFRKVNEHSPGKTTHLWSFPFWLQWLELIVFLFQTVQIVGEGRVSHGVMELTWAPTDVMRTNMQTLPEQLLITPQQQVRWASEINTRLSLAFLTRSIIACSQYRWLYERVNTLDQGSQGCDRSPEHARCRFTPTKRPLFKLRGWKKNAHKSTQPGWSFSAKINTLKLHTGRHLANSIQRQQSHPGEDLIGVIKLKRH